MELVESVRAASPEDAARTVARQLLSKCGAHRVPTPWAGLFKELDVRKVVARELAIEGGLTRATDGSFEIVLRKGGTSARNRFTIAHELGHALFYRHAPRSKQAQQQHGLRATVTEERLCNLIAEELLMPQWYVQDFVSARFWDIYSTVNRIRLDCGVSFRAACIRLAAVAALRGALQIWERSADAWQLLLH
jgi:hypothetical protein